MVMKKFGMLSALESNYNILNIGNFVSYEQNNKIYLAKVLNIKNSKFTISNNVDKELEIPLQRLYKLPNPKNKDLSVKELYEIAIKKQETINLEEIWELVHDDYSEISISELTNIYFGEDILEDHFALRLQLINDKIYFKRLKDTFEPRKNSSIEELKKAALNEEKKKSVKFITSKFFYERIVNKNNIEIPKEIVNQIKLLSEYAANKEGFSNNELRDLKEQVSEINTSCKFDTPNTSPKQAFFLLRQARIFTKHENVFFYKYSYPNKFSSTLENEIRKVKMLNFNDEKREDLTHLDVFSVDDISTLDIDDAISITKKQNGEYLIGIHITDLSESISKDSPLYKSALERGTSVYLPENTYNMFPNDISNDTLSLVKGKRRYALSLLLNVDSNFNITSSRFSRSIIDVKSRLTYEDLDNILETTNDEKYLFLHSFASEYELKRINNGAFSITRKDVYIKLDENFNVTLVENDSQTPAQSIVGELMILYNFYFSDFASKNNIPIYFRGQQKAPELSEEVYNMPEGPVKNYLIRSNMAPSETVTSPIPHSGLGLSSYTQASSPLRRMMDFINQKQITNFIKTGNIYYTSSELIETLMKLDETLKTAGMIIKETKRYWLIEYLRQRKTTNDIIYGTVLRTDMRFPLVEVEEVYMNYVVRSQNPLSVGDRVKLKINNANPREDMLSLEVIA